MRIFSIVVTYNALRNDWLHKCLDSLLSSDLRTEIIVVDNASTDETCQVIKDRYPAVILIENRENIGFGAANNQGLEYGIKNSGDYFFLLNQDAWVEKDCIQKLVAVGNANPEYAVISPMHLNGSGSALDYYFSYFISPQFCKFIYSDFVLGKIENTIYELPFVNAAAWLLPKKTLEVVGGFSPAFFHYREDDNYCQRVIYHKMKIGISPLAKIYHDREGVIKIENNVESELKAKLLKYSNPLLTTCAEHEIKQLKKSLLKNLLMRRSQQVQRDRAKLDFLINRVPELDEYKEFSQTKSLYKFLRITIKNDDDGR